ncbi:MAG: hypothetical protein ACLRSZ_12900 [Enterococcus faecalis]
MVVRKTYDHLKLEITAWNKTNIVAYVACDCGQLARREREKHNHFKCSSCKKEYKLYQGNYVAIDEKTNEEAQNN